MPLAEGSVATCRRHARLTAACLRMPEPYRGATAPGGNEDLEPVVMNGCNQRRTDRTIRCGVSRQAHVPRRSLILALLCCVALATGCIERTITIETEPDDATVFLNDQEVGRSPVQVPFTWYGDYDLIIRKKGYQTIHTHHRVRTPWYQFPLIDIITECMIPFTVHDDRVLDTFVLTPRQDPTKEALLEAAAELKQRALSQAD